MGHFDWKRLKVMVGIPNLGAWTSQFGMSLTAMVGYFNENGVPGYRKQELNFCSIRGSILPQMRWDIIERAGENNCTHLLFVDCDQTFPRETLHRMLLQGKDVLGANIAVKKIPSAPTARAFMEEDPERGVPIYTPEGSNEIQKAWRVGTGILLLSAKAFKAVLPESLEIHWQAKYKKFQGEDWGLIGGLEAAGFEIWVDHGLSNRVGHIGDYSYDHDVVGELQKEQVANG